MGGLEGKKIRPALTSVKLLPFAEPGLARQTVLATAKWASFGQREPLLFALENLAEIVARRAEADAQGSYTRSLLDKGVNRCAKKFGEEATEAVIAAVAEDDAALTAEAADVLYHLLVVLQARKIPLAAVMAELERRTAQSGHAEKAARPT
jgi:phosphoribosyl-ATP pyrophosphohydrolase